MSAKPSLSVLVPSLNCGSLIRGHIATMLPWLDLADEVIVVDSFSDDDTLAIIREQLIHPRLKVLSHPRGLYQSWNYGIAQATGHWLYISTVGDAIERDQLTHLLDAAERLDCDLISSKPDFIDAAGQPAPEERWPIDRILAALSLKEPRVIESAAAFFFSLVDSPMGLVGSAASNLYRTRHLQERPFSTEFGHYGDGAWAITHAFETRFAFTPRRGSWFRYHPKPFCVGTKCAEEIFDRFFKIWRATLAEHRQAKFGDAQAELPFEEMAEKIPAYFYSRIALENLRKKQPAFWVANPIAWRKRRLRDDKRRALNQLIERVVELLQQRRPAIQALKPVAARAE